MSITCIECPSFMKKDEASEYFKITAAGPMCARYGWVFGHNYNAAEAALEKYSENCNARGLTRPTVEIKSKNFGATYVARPDLLQTTPSHSLATCRDCVNFDVNAHACAAQGKMIFPERMEEEPKGCIWAEYEGNTPVAHMEVGPLLQHLSGKMVDVSVSITPKPVAAKAVKPNKPTLIKWPRDYDSDAEVDDDDKHMIRAYRKVDTRVGPIFLPIFQTFFFDEDEQSKIPDPTKAGTSDPSLYIDHAGLLERFAVIVYKLDQNLCLVGEPGVGKSVGVEWLAWMMNMPFERLPYNESSEPDQFLGSPAYGDTGEVMPSGEPILGTYFKPGLLPKAWVKPNILLSDEFNLPQEAIKQVYRSMNDSGRVLVVYDHKFYRHDYCFNIGAINDAHDFRNIGAAPMASADSSRLTFMRMPNPDTDMLRKILVSNVKNLDGVEPDPFLVTTIIKIGEDLRNLSREGKLPDFWTPRQEVKVARMAPYFGLFGAYAAAYTDYVDTNTKELVEGCIRSHIPSGPDWAN